MNGLFDGPRGEQTRTAFRVAAWVLVGFLAVGVVSGLSKLRYIGTGVAATNTISVQGHGEAMAVPDIATFTVTVTSLKATVAAAQEDATAKANAVTAYLTGAGVDKKDIQTSDYSIYPQYEYQNAVCPSPLPAVDGAYSTPVYCPPGKQTLKGYEVRQMTTVKVRDTAKAGELLGGVGGKGATEVSGLTFTFDNPQSVQSEARSKAIAEAKKRADELAKQLGVSIVRVVSFSENGGGYYPPMPYAYGKGGDARVQSSASPEISVGQNKVSSDVSITYEIR